ncbi:MAG: phosphonate ABC transporter ATP-binding protein [Planctomycetaceae bacterium]
MAGGRARFRLTEAAVRYESILALEGATLEIAAGEAVGFVGPSGAGKTTLLRLLNGTVRPASGRVEVDGVDLATLSNGALRRLRSRIGFVHQEFSLVPNLRVSQNLVAGKLGRRSLFASLRSMLRPAAADLERAHEILERVGIPEKLFERTDRLSGGQKQRVAIARALFQEPDALLADEPVSSVDPARARDTVSLLTSISRERGLTLCMSLHNLELAREYFPRLVGLRHGRVVFDLPTAAIGPADFHALYDLTAQEILGNGS